MSHLEELAVTIPSAISQAEVEAVVMFEAVMLPEIITLPSVVT